MSDNRTPEQAREFFVFVNSEVGPSMRNAMLSEYVLTDEVTIDLRDDHGPSEYIVSNAGDWWFNGFSSYDEAEAWCARVGLHVKTADPIAALGEAWKGDTGWTMSDDTRDIIRAGGRALPEDGE